MPGLADSRFRTRAAVRSKGSWSSGVVQVIDLRVVVDRRQVHQRVIIKPAPAAAAVTLELQTVEAKASALALTEVDRRLREPTAWAHEHLVGGIGFPTADVLLPGGCAGAS